MRGSLSSDRSASDPVSETARQRERTDTDGLSGFDGGLGLALATTLLLRLLVTLGALRAGVTGGLLTPGLTIGGLLGIILGSLWNHTWSGVSLGAFAIIGSVAFLASSMKMPLTAIALIVELTRIGHDFLIPISLAVAGSIYVFYLCTEYNFQAIWKHGSVHISTLLSKVVDSLAHERGSATVTR